MKIFCCHLGLMIFLLVAVSACQRKSMSSQLVSSPIPEAELIPNGTPQEFVTPTPADDGGITSDDGNSVVETGIEQDSGSSQTSSSCCAFDSFYMMNYNHDGVTDIVAYQPSSSEFYLATSRITGTEFDISKIADAGRLRPARVGSFGGGFRNGLVGYWEPDGKWYLGLLEYPSVMRFVELGLAAPVPSASHMLLGDVNGDSSDDLILWWQGRLHVHYYGDDFNHWRDFGELPEFTDLVVGDFNGDGNDDLLARLLNGVLLVGHSVNDSFSWQSEGAVGQIANLVVADWDGNGDDDAFFQSLDTHELFFALSEDLEREDTGLRLVNLGVSGLLTDATLTYFDGDTLPDILAYHPESYTWAAILSRRQRVDVLFVARSDSFLQVLSGDLNGDGLWDFLFQYDLVQGKNYMGINQGGREICFFVQE